MHFNQVCLAPGEAMKTVILFSLEGGLSSNLDLPSLHSVEKFMSNISSEYKRKKSKPPAVFCTDCNANF